MTTILCYEDSYLEAINANLRREICSPLPPTDRKK